MEKRKRSTTHHQRIPGQTDHPHTNGRESESGHYMLSVTEMVKTACRNAGQEESDHFVDVTKMIELGKGAQREIDDIEHQS
jgi:hypothetical protein